MKALFYLWFFLFAGMSQVFALDLKSPEFIGVYKTYKELGLQRVIKAMAKGMRKQGKVQVDEHSTLMSIATTKDSLILNFVIDPKKSQRYIDKMVAIGQMPAGTISISDAVELTMSRNLSFMRKSMCSDKNWRAALELGMKHIIVVRLVSGELLATYTSESKNC
jgi:3-mercaptopyruvate sulfurtransferase SseA